MATYQITLNEIEIAAAVKKSLLPGISISDETKVMFVANVTNDGEMVNLRAMISGAPTEPPAPTTDAKSVTLTI